MNSTDRLNRNSSIHRFLAVTAAAATTAATAVSAKQATGHNKIYRCNVCVCVCAAVYIWAKSVVPLFSMWLNGFARKSSCRCRCRCYVFFLLVFLDFFIVRQMVCLLATLFFQWSDLPVVLSLHITHCRHHRWRDHVANAHYIVEHIVCLCERALQRKLWNFYAIVSKCTNEWITIVIELSYTVSLCTVAIAAAIWLEYATVVASLHL